MKNGDWPCSVNRTSYNILISCRGVFQYLEFTIRIPGHNNDLKYLVYVAAYKPNRKIPITFNGLTYMYCTHVPGGRCKHNNIAPKNCRRVEGRTHSSIYINHARA